MNKKITITRTLSLPDKIKIARSLRAPDLGPRILFFSGGSALRQMSQHIIDYTHNSIHLITSFDSGGSSAELRKSFSMLAVGDIRNRLMALADRSLKGNPEVFNLFSYRFPKDAGQDELLERLKNMVQNQDDLMKTVRDPMRKIVRTHLRFFLERMPDTFDLRGASIGNLILAGGFFNYNRHIDPVIYLFSKLVEARGVVRPIVNRNIHLAATTADGKRLVGQHLITGKEVAPIASPITDLYLTREEDSEERLQIPIRKKTRELIQTCDLICFPMGSFYTSLIANLLPAGVGDAVRNNKCPKIYIPNLGNDPEMKGMTLFDAVKTIIDYLDRSSSERSPVGDLLNFILIDSANGNYPAPLELAKIRRYGIEIIDTPLVTEESAPYLDERKVLDVLLSLC
ncbi:MAG: GAK system CofD-like protein [Desulfovibrio sp.]|uniref:GAK system CofD-like protein n=1 Tax=Desulfovibrio sp. 7SRBS1 TaxID=3378064 RepID=UPI003B420C45